MKSVEELKEIRENNYRKWFERFFKSKQIEKQIEILNEKGRTEAIIDTETFNNDRDKMMIKDEMFIKLLEEKLPGFNVNVNKGSKSYTFFGVKCERSYYKVNISW